MTSSSRNIVTMERKSPRSLIGSPVPCRLRDVRLAHSVICSPVVLRRNTSSKSINNKESYNNGFFSNSEKEDVEINQLRLEKVFGFTIQNNSSVSLDPTSGIIAFPAGCVVIGYSAKRSKQFFIHNSTKSPITALAFSKDGKLLATGESGKAPKVRIWNVETRSQVAEFNGHNYRVGALTFSPNSRLIVSVGSQEDMTINVWEMSSNLKIASSRVTSKVNAVTFSETGSFFVTVGVRHVRFWYLDNSRSKTKTTIALSGRNAILGDFMNNTFNDVGCCCLNSNSGVGQMTSSMCSNISSSNSQSYTYVISQAGQLMQFTEQRYLDKWVELQTPKPTCLTVCESYIMVGCSQGIILMFDTASLSHIATLPKPHYLGINIDSFDSSKSDRHDLTRYPDIIAGKYDHIHSRITYFYNDHSLYVWDVRDIHHPVKVTSHLFHSGGVWSVEPVPLSQGDKKGILDVSSFITCSDDETIRFWNLPESHSKLNHSQNDKLQSTWQNDYSKELLKIIYTDPHLKCLTENDKLLAVKNNNQSNEVNVTLKHGIRSIKISPDRQQLAMADREGNLRFYSMVDCKELYSIVAHNGEILSIDYFQSPSSPGLILFCSASRDRIIHVMDPCQEYKCIQTIDDHSGAIFSVKFVETPDQEIRLISCGTDKSLLFRIFQPDESGQTAQFFLNQHLVGKQSQYDMVIAPNNRYAVVACQDRQVRIYNLVTGKQRKSYRGSNGEDGNLVRCAIDPSGTYLATSGSDKYLHILNFTTGEILASITGHSEMALGLCFLYDLKHLVSVSSDNCIFVWRLPVQMTLTMHQRMKDLGSPNYFNFPECDLKKDTAPPSTCGTVTPPHLSDDMNIEPSNLSHSTTVIGDNAETTSPSTFRFSVSALPSWAQKKLYMQALAELDHVNMINEFCPGMSTVTERKNENYSFDEAVNKDNALSRRMSFIATEKVVRDDDSDNVEDEDLEWFGNDKSNFKRSMDLESLIQRVSTGDEEEEDDEESVLDNKRPLRSSSLENEEIIRQHCSFVIKQNKEPHKVYNDNIMSTSAPSTLATWLDERVSDCCSEDPSMIHADDSEIHNDVKTFSFDDNSTFDDVTVTSTGAKGSLTTRYLTKTSAGSNIVNYQYKADNVTIDKSFLRPTETSSRKANVPFNCSTMKKSFPSKSRSEVNVSEVGTVRKKSDQFNKPINTAQHTITKVNFSHGKPSQDRPESRDRKQNEKKQKLNSTERRSLSKSISTASVSTIDQTIETRPKSSSVSQTIKKTMETKTIPNKSVIDTNVRSTRPKWADNKRTRDIRKTCPVDMKDIKAASSRHTMNKSTKIVESVPLDTQRVNVDQNKNDLIKEPLKDVDENHKQKHVLAKGSSFDLLSCRGKEHVIDEIEELPGPSLSSQFKSDLNSSSFEEMLQYLSNKNQRESNDHITVFSNVLKTENLGGECEMTKSIELYDMEVCTDDFIEELCGSHNLDFLTTMASKILRRLVESPDLSTESQRQVAIRLLTEVERIYHQLRSTLELGALALEGEDTASLIKDIGDRIVDEVKRRLSESL